MKNSVIDNYKKAFSLMHKTSKMLIPATILSSFFTTLIPYVSLYFSGIIVDGIISNKSYEVILTDATYLVVIVLVCGVIAEVLTKARLYLGDKAQTILKVQIAKKAITLNYETFENPEIQQLRKKAESGTNYNGGLPGMVENLAGGFITGIFSILFSLGGIIVLVLSKSNLDTPIALFSNSIWYTICLAILIGLPVVLSIFINMKAAEHQQSIFDEIVFINRVGEYFNRIIADYENGKMFRMYQMQDFIININRKYTVKSMEWFKKLYKAIYSYNTTSQIIGVLATGLLYCLVITKAYVGAITVGSILMYVGYLQRMLHSLSISAAQISSSSIVVNYLRSYYDYLSLEVDDMPKAEVNSADFEIVFENVSFKYPNSDNYSLRNVNCTIRKGEKLAIVGQNGTGKTTFIKLLCNLYKPTEGRILLNGVDINSIDSDSYTDLIAVVFQDFKLFATTLAQNIACTHDVDYQRLDDALNIVGIENRVDRMDKGVESMITRYLDDTGIELSGGEAQKVAIARAWYKNSPLIILDEPTAALDPLSEFEIYNNFNEIVTDKSAIYISHRMSSCQFCERIIVFDAGTIIQEGNHSSLMNDTSGLYFKLFDAQAQYYTDENIDLEVVSV